MYEELSARGFTIIAVSLDASAEAAREWVDASDPAPTYPILLDVDQIVPELYGIVNIPSVVWIDEEGHIVRPVDIAPADDKFRDFTGIDSAPHHDALRRWVNEDVAPLSQADVEARLPTADGDVQRARAERRLAAWLHRAGDTDAAERHFARAATLAPHDFTIRRGSMLQRGQDPFGTEFFEFWQEWDDAGRPGYAPH
ncbi:MAG: hypothetical protein QOF97_2787 [Acidimicrobiaceae bacterium]